MTLNFDVLEGLGFSAFFRQQLGSELQTAWPARVITVERRRLTLLDSEGERDVTMSGRLMGELPEDRATVGDWLLLEPDGERIARLLERKSLFKRMSAGVKVDVQLIAANVDTLFVVTSCNADFNPSRLERYLALAFDSGVTPVVVLTKADEAPDAERYRSDALALRRGLSVELVNALDAGTLGGVRAWCTRGQTVAVAGSSGVGKSTLINSLAGIEVETTGAIRASDQRGRHTTTRRWLHQLPGGALIVDSPGMRELKLADAGAGLGEVFDDIEALVQRCRFVDCEHETEPGCAVREALDRGVLDERRYTNYRKLLREQRYARESIAERHARTRRFGRMVRAHMKESHKKR